MNNIQQVLSEGRLIRKTWSEVSDGRQLLCLYTAWRGDPDARPNHCPAEAAPMWFAGLMTWIDDAGSEKKWPEVVSRVAALEPKFSKFGRRELLGCLIAILTETKQHSNSPECLEVAALCKRELSGTLVSKSEWAAAIKTVTRVGALGLKFSNSKLVPREVGISTALNATTWAATAAAGGGLQEEAVAAAAEAATEAAAWMAGTRLIKVPAADRIIDGILSVLEAA